MIGLIPGGSVYIEIVYQLLWIVVVSFYLSVEGWLYIFRCEEVLVYVLLPVFHKLVIHQFAFGIVVIDKHQINGSRRKASLIFIFPVFLYIELLLATFCQCPALSGLQFIGNVLYSFYMSGRRFGILMRTTVGLYLVPVGMQVAFYQPDRYFGRVFMQLVFCFVFGNHRIFGATIKQ